MARADIISWTTSASALQYNGGGSTYIVQKNGTTNTFYIIFADPSADVSYIKSTDGGFTWSAPVNIYTGTVVAIANWYDRWSGRNSDKIRIAYTASDHIIRYRDLDIATDTLGTETTVFTGVSTASNGGLSIVTGRDGRLVVAGSIDAGAEDGAWSSVDDGATWGDTIADPSEGGSADQYYLLPGWNADTSDIMLIFVDASANGLSVKRYDDSGNSWSESAIVADGSFVDLSPGNNYPHVACAVDLANSRNVIIAWNAVDAANQDLTAFVIDDTNVTALTNVVTNATDDCGLCALAIDTGSNIWYAFYGGNTDGSETFSTAIKIYYKTSSDAGTTWGDQTALSAFTRSTQWLTSTPRFGTAYLTSFYSTVAGDDMIVTSVNIPSAAASGGQGWWGG